MAKLVQNVTNQLVPLPEGWGAIAPGKTVRLPEWLYEHKGVQIDLRMGTLKVVPVDVSDAADARRFRWLMNGNAHEFSEDVEFCANAADLERLRIDIDMAMADQ